MGDLAGLRRYLASFRKVVVAFSGGVDSATLAALAAKVTEVLAVTVASPLTPRSEVGDARRIAEEIGVDHEIVELDLLAVDAIAQNREDRCYHCKKAVLSELKKIAEREGYEAVFEGTNASDGWREGLKAAKELGVESPWLLFGFGKDEIRELAREMGYSFWSKPSNSCLATRIPYSTPLDRELLRRVEIAEEIVKGVVGVDVVRVRVIGRAAIVEAGEVAKLLDLEVAERLVDSLKEVGFQTVLLDLEGYRPGKIQRYT